MQFIQTSIPDVILIKPEVFNDDRGFFMETWQRRKFAQGGINEDFVQDNHSRSVRGTLRGLHYQIQQAQGKLVRVTLGEVFDVAVDIRRGSSTYGKWVGEHLSADNKHMLWMPQGFAHGFYVVSPIAEVQYRCTDYYAPQYERCIRWDDPAIGICWPFVRAFAIRLSSRDSAGKTLDEADVYRVNRPEFLGSSIP